MSTPSVVGDADGDRRGDRDAPARSDSPSDLRTTAWGYVLRRTAREFIRDQCVDLAAGLTFYSSLALLPAAIALVSLVGLVGTSGSAVRTVVQMLDEIGASSTAHSLQPALVELSHSHRAGLALGIGLAAALWTSSRYVAAFGRAMNRIYAVPEGRPFWKRRPYMLLLAAVTFVLGAVVVLALVFTGPAARAAGDAIGVGSTAVTVWNIAKWPVVLVVVALIVALLYYATPNIRQPHFRWISVGAAVAILTWVVASVLFGVYVAHFSSYNRTYGSLAAAAIFLLWLWITNLALLFGAELDAELERGRELQAGLPAEDRLQAPLRETSASRRAERIRRRDIAAARQLRRTGGRRD